MKQKAIIIILGRLLKRSQTNLNDLATALLSAGEDPGFLKGGG